VGTAIGIEEEWLAIEGGREVDLGEAAHMRAQGLSICQSPTC